jgi:hypothetical protein
LSKPVGLHASDRLAPALSVVVAASDSAAAVAATLTALGRQRGVARLEVIVAAARDRLAGPVMPMFASPLADVAWVFAAPGTSVPRLRRLGLDRTTAPIVAFTEDSCVFGPGWSDAWVAAFADRSVQAATGPVEAAMGERAADWAVFLCEYAPFLAPAGAGAIPGTRLAGNNFAVRRSALVALNPPEIHETEIATASSPRPGAEVVVAAACARHVRRYALREAIGDRLRFGHIYGAHRARGWPRAARWAGIVAGPLILGVQAARLAAIIAARRRYLGRFLAVLPVTLGLLSAWSVGEWLGWAGTLVRRTAARRRHEGAGRSAA